MEKYNKNFNYEPLAGSKKNYKESSKFTGLRVPFRTVELSSTVDDEGKETYNDPVELYDTSGPYTDKGS